MVRIPRYHCTAPAELRENEAAWRDRWRRIHSEGSRVDWATNAAKAILRSALRRLTHGKCAYCESRLDKDTYLEIDHCIAKTIAPDKAFEWTNLFPSCRLCNNGKRDADHKGLLLKPDDEDPEPYFWLTPIGELQPDPSLAEGQRRRAEETIRLCNLSRGALASSRVEMIKWVAYLLRNPSKEMLEFILDPKREFKLVIRRALEQNGHQDIAAEDRRRFEAPLA